jgi:hypothetical protein
VLTAEAKATAAAVAKLVQAPVRLPPLQLICVRACADAAAPTWVLP